MYIYILLSVKVIIGRRIIIYIRFQLTNKSQSLFIRSCDCECFGGGGDTVGAGGWERSLAEERSSFAQDYFKRNFFHSFVSRFLSREVKP